MLWNCIQKVLRSNLRRQTFYPDWPFSWFSSVVKAHDAIVSQYGYNSFLFIFFLIHDSSATLPIDIIRVQPEQLTTSLKYATENTEDCYWPRFLLSSVHLFTIYFRKIHLVRSSRSSRILSSNRLM